MILIHYLFHPAHLVFFSILTYSLIIIHLHPRSLFVIGLNVLIRSGPGILRLGSCFCGLLARCRCLLFFVIGLVMGESLGANSNIIYHMTTYHSYQVTRNLISILVQVQNNLFLLMLLIYVQ